MLEAARKSVFVPRPMKPVERRVLVRLARGETYEQIAAREGMPGHRVIDVACDLHTLFGAATTARTVAVAHGLGVLPRDAYPTPMLSERRAVLLGLVSDGLLNREIAVRVGVSAQTVGNSLMVLYRAMGAKNRPSAVHIGYCTGILGAKAVTP